ncbi:hypothetical protein BT63DRAFT_409294 [Microthyrium microscopicum]|uniref:Phosphoglycerate mutase-like protein n=1 Tax=Microthyrium microscopicum TaxID=703497 RepID=A0A6A6UVT5_9PEZI|nr:hypothetical protein BT63DRAFT_409294 [Microthyrium microscopicum]
MPRTPDKLFVVRHGARLDEVRRQPQEEFEYFEDSPLTMGGWIQAQTTGYRIASMLLDPSLNSDGRVKRIFIHSSPFLRCIQTTIGIAAGISGFAPSIEVKSNLPPHTESSSSDFEPEPLPFLQPVVRIEPWLGEWMTKNYFRVNPEDSKVDAPDPKEVFQYAFTIMGGMGIDYLPNCDEGDYLPPTDPARAPISKELLQDAFEAMASEDAAQEVRLNGRRNSHPPLPLSDLINGGAYDLQTGIYQNHSEYSPYPTDQIPAGVIAHARDACLAFDSEWKGLGEGGHLDESWEVFTNRISTGFESLISWYLRNPLDTAEENISQSQDAPIYKISTHDTDIDMDIPDLDPFDLDPQDYDMAKSIMSEHLAQEKERRDIDHWLSLLSNLDTADTALSATDYTALQSAKTDYELIVICVTHNGGCNAFQFSCSQRPVLNDFPQASLTLAYSSQELDAEQGKPLLPQYKIALTGNADHLRRKSVFNRMVDSTKREWRESAPAFSERFHRREEPEEKPRLGLWGSGQTTACETTAGGGLWQPR